MLLTLTILIYLQEDLSMFKKFFTKAKTPPKITVRIQFYVCDRWLTYGIKYIIPEAKSALFASVSEENTMKLPCRILHGDDVIYMEYMTFPKGSYSKP